jgi:hypothetical protein
VADGVEVRDVLHDAAVEPCVSLDVAWHFDTQREGHRGAKFRLRCPGREVLEVL